MGASREKEGVITITCTGAGDRQAANVNLFPTLIGHGSQSQDPQCLALLVFGDSWRLC